MCTGTDTTDTATFTVDAVDTAGATFTADAVDTAASLAASRGMAHAEQLSRTPASIPPALRTSPGARADVREEPFGASPGWPARWERGLAHGDRLAVLMTNSIEMIEVMFAGWRLGAIVVPVNFRLVADEVAVHSRGLRGLGRRGRRRPCPVGRGGVRAALPDVACGDRRRGPGGSRCRILSATTTWSPTATRTGDRRGRRAGSCTDHVHLRHHRASERRGPEPLQPAR